MVRNIENDDPPPVSVASPMRWPSFISPSMSNRPEPMKVLEVGQWIRLAPASFSRARSRGDRWIA